MRLDDDQRPNAAADLSSFGSVCLCGEHQPGVVTGVRTHKALRKHGRQVGRVHLVVVGTVGDVGEKPTDVVQSVVVGRRQM